MQITPTEEIVPLVRPRDIARLLAVSERSISNWARDKIIPSVRIGSTTLRFDQNAVLAAIAAANGKNTAEEVSQ